MVKRGDGRTSAPSSHHRAPRTTNSSTTLSQLPLLVVLTSMAASLSTLTYPHPISYVVGAGLVPLVILSRWSPLLRYYARLTAYVGSLAICSGWGVVVSIVMTLLGKSKDINWLVARSFYYLCSPLVGMRFTVEGEEVLRRTKPAIIVGNHQTMVDILYLGKVFPKGASIMAKRELQWTPFLGQYMTLSRAVFINRASRGDAVAVFAKVAATMKAKTLSLFIFPEGTRSHSIEPTLLPFKKGAFHLAVAAKLPIVPIVCENYSSAYNAKSKRFEDGDLVIKVLEPIETEGFSSSSEDITKLLNKTRDAMMAALEELAQRRGSGTASSSGQVVDGGNVKNPGPQDGERDRLLNS